MPLPAHAASIEEVLRDIGTDRTAGLTDAEARARLEKHGTNELKEAPGTPWWEKLLRQFNELVIWILIVAAVISGIAQDWPDAVAIMAIVLLNGILGFLQEERAEAALAALQEMSAPNAKVLREGQLRTIAARELVPGDRIRLEAGDNVPADSRLIEAFSLQVQEAALTGESVPVEKQANQVLPEDTSLGDRKNSVYMSTIVTAGKADAVVIGTGMQTELGRIAGLLQQQEAEPTPLQRRLAELGKILVVLCLTVVVLIFFLELRRGGGPVKMYQEGHLTELLLRSVSLAVAAVPEGLPAVVTLALAIGLQRMVARNVLIRRLPSVETLGSVTVICSDKTGTLTRNEMTVRAVIAGGEWYRVTGTGYAPKGSFLGGREAVLNDAEAPPAAITDDLQKVLTIGLRCNNAQLVQKGDKWDVIGDPTEAALLVAGMKAGLEQKAPGETLVHENPFDSDRKMMSVVIRGADGRQTLLVKGAPDVMLGNCVSELKNSQIVPLNDARRRELEEINSKLAHEALRVLAFAFREDVDSEAGYEEKGLVFAGMMGMIDPPREEVKVAIARCREAGIRPVMITGDHPETAAAIARELTLAEPGQETIPGRQIDALDDAQLKERVAQIAVYARVSPEHKLRVVNAWRGRGQVVAMTGDGVNDAPAVKAADIGIAMGITGTDVTKQASDMVLTDDNFTSIVNAVEEGRGIFDNIQKFIHYLLSCNVGEVLLMLAASVLGWPAPLVAIQLLWINLVTDGLPALALGMEPTEADAMKRPPRPPSEPVITRERGLLILSHGCLIALAAGLGFAITRSWHPGGEDKDLAVARTVCFCIMAFSQLFFSIGCRSHTRTLPELGLFTNMNLVYAILISGSLQLAVLFIPWFHGIFESGGRMTSMEWGLVIGLSLMPVTVIEVTKLVRRAVGHPATQAGART